MDKSVSVEYATALADFSLDVKETLVSLEAVSEVLKDNEFMKFLKHPLISKEEKKEVFKKTFSFFNEVLLSFLYVLIDNDRIDILPDIITSYSNIDDEKNNIMTVEIISSKELMSEAKEEIIKILKKRFNKDIKAKLIVDAKIIDGLIIKYQGQILDASVIGKLNDLKESIGI